MHPRIVLFLGICFNELENTLLMVEELMRCNLKEFIENEKPNITTKLRIAMEICEGMMVLHHNNPPIVHRNLKPENILIDFDGHVKITNFGLSFYLFKEEKKGMFRKTCIFKSRSN